MKRINSSNLNRGIFLGFGAVENDSLDNLGVNLKCLFGGDEGVAKERFKLFECSRGLGAFE